MGNHEKLLKLTFIETVLLFVCAFVIFAAFRMWEPEPVDADFDAVGAALVDGGYTEIMEPGNALRIKSSYGLLPSDYEEALLFAPQNYMDVDEVLLLRLPEGASTDAALEAVEGHLERARNIFENYGTDQFSLLEKAVIYDNAPYVLYCAGHQSEETARLVRGMIER